MESSNSLSINTVRNKLWKFRNNGVKRRNKPKIGYLQEFSS